MIRIRLVMQFLVILLFSGPIFSGPVLSDTVNANEPTAENSLVNEVKFGVLLHDPDKLWSGSSREEGVDYNMEVVFSPSYRLWSGTVRPVIGASINSTGDTSKIYFDGRWQYLFNHPGYFAVGVGIALHDGEKDRVSSETKALGSSVLFHAVFEYGYYFNKRNSISLFFDHISNAGLNDNNQGLDTIGLRLGHQF